MIKSPTNKHVIWFCIVPALTGLVALAGWTLKDERLKSVLPGLIDMNPLTAVCFIIAAGALWLRSQTPSIRQQRVGTSLAALVALVGGLKLSSYLFGFGLPIDRWLFADALGDNRMAPNTSLCFLLTGGALATLDRVRARGFWPAQVATLAVATVSLVSLVGYAYGATSLYRMASHVPMALNTAAAFGVLAIGILLARPERGVVAVIFDPGPGGVMARRLLPAVVAIPCLLGWLRVVGQQLGYYDTEFGAALMVAATVTLFVVAIGCIAAALNRSDWARTEAEQSIRRLNEELERRVAERTAELAAANADLTQKNQENEMFVYSVSHDLRSPLVNLQGFSQELALVTQSIRKLVADGGLPADKSQQGLELIDVDMQRGIHFIQNAVGRLSGIIDSLLRLSRAGRVEYQPQRIDTVRLIERIVESMSATIFDRGVAVEVAPLPPAFGDATAIEQVFANLIGNSLNYLDPARPGRIEVGLLTEDSTSDETISTTTYYVKDNGLGIDPAYHGKVFQALKRLHPEAAQGEGIGLAIVKRIVDRHNGEIWFESTVGAGTTFFVKLPIAGVTVESAPESRAPKHERSSSDDQRIARDLVGGRR
jgi:signal transduction histidine kinase